MQENLINIREMAKKLDLPVSWLYSRTRTREIPFLKVGKYVKFYESEVMSWLKKQNEDD